MTGSSADWVIEVLSPARMAPYLAQTNGDVDAAFRLYQWNLSVCTAFYDPLHWLEVAARNAMHDVLRDHFGTEFWWQKVQLVGTWQAKVERVEAQLKERFTPAGRTMTADDVVAELNFGFWVSLVTRGNSYDRTLWVPALHRAFPNFSDGRRRKLHDELNPVRLFRNRIMHYEPIFNRRLLDYHRDIYRLLGYLSTKLKAETRRLDRVPQVLAERPDLGGA
ncbi:hypothetical protein ABT324_03245 [Saccharopolyspora sp. NPDC000359]|uniref:hypothetical protein n=1 Tax=Saccharopolyspora sp. NPDC000359 TaxID=3154251 RepID=UPI00332D1EAE